VGGVGGLRLARKKVSFLARLQEMEAPEPPKRRLRRGLAAHMEELRKQSLARPRFEGQDDERLAVVVNAVLDADGQGIDHKRAVTKGWE
jgi:hypothetical protein